VPSSPCRYRLSARPRSVPLARVEKNGWLTRICHSPIARRECVIFAIIDLASIVASGDSRCAYEGKGLVRFCISVRGIRVGPEILELGKHSLENLEPRSRVSYVVNDTRVGWTGLRALLPVPKTQSAFHPLAQRNALPSPRCASAIHIIRPSLVTAETQPQLQPA
jgi:hypothetical protein